MNALRIAAVALAFLLPPPLAHAERTDIKTRAGVTFVVSYPKFFRYDATSKEGDIPASFTLRYADKSGKEQLAFQVIIDRMTDEENWKDQASVDKFVEIAGAKNLANSLEKLVTPVHFQPETGFGSYAVFTDASVSGSKEPKAGEFKQMIMGAIRRDKYLILLRGYTNSTSEQYFKTANAVLEKIEIVSHPQGN